MQHQQQAAPVSATFSSSSTASSSSSSSLANRGAADEEGFDLPATVLEEDVPVLQNLLTALHGMDPLVERYKVELVATGYLVRAALSPAFELGLDDLLYLQSISPARIERVALARAAGGQPLELLVRVLDAKQRVMITSTVAFFNATRKRRRVTLPLAGVRGGAAGA